MWSFCLIVTYVIRRKDKEGKERFYKIETPEDLPPEERKQREAEKKYIYDTGEYRVQFTRSYLKNFLDPLNDRERFLWLVLSLFRSKKNEAWPKHKELAVLTNMKTMTIRRVLLSLKSKGYIDISERPGMSSLIHFLK